MGMDSIHCRFLMFASRVENRPFSILDIFGHCTTKQLPIQCRPDDFCVISFWKGPRNTRADFTIRISGPHGFAYSTAGTVRFANDETAYSVGTFADLQFPHLGDYRFEVLFDGDVHVSEILPVMPEI